MKTNLDIALIERYYRIEADGAIYSYRLGRYLGLPRCGGYKPYRYVSLPDAGVRSVAVHVLVARKYLKGEGQVTFKDGNVLNTHWGNLEYRSVSEIRYRSYKTRFVDKKSFAVSEQKYKKSVVSSRGDRWKGIGECARELGYSRVGIWKSIKTGQELRLGFSVRHE